MKAKQMIEGASASYGPEALKVISQAFDDAWVDIAANFGDNPSAIEAGRLKLAHVILSIATPQRGDAAMLKRAALAAMALEVRTPA
jgi:hypothetical protein